MARPQEITMELELHGRMTEEKVKELLGTMIMSPWKFVVTGMEFDTVHFFGDMEPHVRTTLVKVLIHE